MILTSAGLSNGAAHEFVRNRFQPRGNRAIQSDLRGDAQGRALGIDSHRIAAIDPDRVVVRHVAVRHGS
jgi:hypothetical protein